MIESRPMSPAVLKEPQPPKDKPSPLYVAFNWLGSRLSERPGSGYWLDGVPASLNSIMRETNRVIAEAGAEQVGGNPDWLYR